MKMLLQMININSKIVQSMLRVIFLALELIRNVSDTTVQCKSRGCIIIRIISDRRIATNTVRDQARESHHAHGFHSDTGSIGFSGNHQIREPSADHTTILSFILSMKSIRELISSALQ